jgi:hypothetical protein
MADVEDLETVLSAAVLLHDNGQSTDMTLIALHLSRRVQRASGAPRADQGRSSASMVSI